MSGKVARCDRVGRSLIGKISGKLFGQDSINPIRYMSRHNSGKTLGGMLGYDSGNDSVKASSNLLRRDSGKPIN
jgi:hypothetical protein